MVCNSMILIFYYSHAEFYALQQIVDSQMKFEDLHDFRYSHLEFYDFHNVHDSHMKL